VAAVLTPAAAACEAAAGEAEADAVGDSIGSSSIRSSSSGGCESTASDAASFHELSSGTATTGGCRPAVRSARAGSNDGEKKSTEGSTRGRFALRGRAAPTAAAAGMAEEAAAEVDSAAGGDAEAALA
jgi:hypothetical protein